MSVKSLIILSSLTLLFAGCFSASVGRNAQYLRAIELFDQEKYEDAARAFGQAAEKGPKKDDALFNQGLSHLKAGRFLDAVSIYERFLIRKPDSAEAHINLAFALNGLGRDQEAALHFIKAIELEPVRVFPLCSFARYLLDREEPDADDSADKYISEAERINPDDSTVAYLRGVIDARKGRRLQAKQAFAHALELDSQNVQAMVRLGQYELEDGAYARAINRFTKAAALDPENVAAWLGAARCYRSLGRYRRALESLWRVQDLDPAFQDLDLEMSLTLTAALRSQLGLSTELSLDDILEALRPQ